MPEIKVKAAIKEQEDRYNRCMKDVQLAQSPAAGEVVEIELQIRISSP